MTRHFVIAVLFLLFVGDVAADCRGCCSHHNGVVCAEGKTKCGDGTQLSTKCRSKGCSVCDDEEPQAPTSTPAALQSKEYNRKDWPHWIDEDGDCQDTRAEILIRDNVGELKFKRNKECNVSWGKWVCPYTGKVFTKASDVDIDHIVSLSWAHRHGAANWSREKKRAFANDPENLLVVDDATNQEKSDRGPDEWLPPRPEYRSEYLKRWRIIETKFGLTKDYEAKKTVRH